MTEFFWRIWIAVVLVTLAVLAVFVLLATLQFQNINAGLTGDRLTVLADRTAGPFKAPAKIGLPLSSVRNADALLERARQTDRQIIAVHVYDSGGKIVHSTMSRAPDGIPAPALSAMQSADGGRWQISNGQTFISGVNIPDMVGRTAGGVMVVYPTSGHLTQVRAMAAELGFAALGGLIVVAMVGAVLLRLLLGRMFRNFQKIEDDITEFERNAWRSAAGSVISENGDSTDPEKLGNLLSQAEAAYRNAGKDLAKQRHARPEDA